MKASLESLLQQKFEQNPQLVTGELENGLRYVILPNKIPPKRFEAHLEIHAGAPSALASYFHVGLLFHTVVVPDPVSIDPQCSRIRVFFASVIMILLWAF